MGKKDSGIYVTPISTDNNIDTNEKNLNSGIDHSFRKRFKNISIHFYVALAIIYSGIILVSRLAIHYQWKHASDKSQKDIFNASNEIIELMAQRLNNELTQKIGRLAELSFSSTKQIFKKHVNAVRDGLYDPMKDCYKLVYDMIRAEKSTIYATLAFEDGYYLANGHLTISMIPSKGTGDPIEECKEILHNMA